MSMNAARTALRNRPTASTIADTTFAFDGTICTIKRAGDDFTVTVTERGIALPLTTLDGGDLVSNGVYNVNLDARLTAWERQRMVYVFGLAARRMAAA
jgi:hypothetical protein